VATGAQGWMPSRLCRPRDDGQTTSSAAGRRSLAVIEALVRGLLEHRHLSGGTAIFMALGVFGGDEAARRSNVIPLNQAFGRLK
jgi:hypothetical protein